MKMKLNLGSGFRPHPGYVNIDCSERCKPDLLHDITTGLPYEDNSVDEIIAADFLEHIPIGKTVFVIEEIWRVLKPGGTLEHFTPSTDGRGAFQDPTHVSFWNQNSWLYYTHDAYRDLYGIKAKFNIEFMQDYRSMDNVVHTRGLLHAIK
jgi:predicted SAM-dependent methyltransferase